MTNKPTPASQPSIAPEGLAKQFGYPAIEQPSPARSDRMEAEPKPGAHHLTMENVAAVIKDLREIEDGTTERPIIDRDWRTWAGVLARIMEWLAESAPSGGSIGDDPKFRELLRAHRVAYQRAVDGFDPADEKEVDEGVNAAWRALVAHIDARRATAGTTAAPSSDMLASGLREILASARGLKGTSYICVLAGAMLNALDNERATAGNAAPTDAEFKNFHRLLCERFGYTHDERDWKRDQLSLIEFIATPAATAAPGDLPPLPGVVGEGRAETRVVLTKGDLTLMLEKYGRACIASNAGAAIPEGWKLVPISSTLDMEGAGVDVLPDGCYQLDAERCWSAMLAAAPSDTSPVGAQQEKEQ